MDNEHFQNLRDETASKLLVEIVRTSREKNNFSVLNTDIYTGLAINLANELIEKLKDNPV